MTAASRVRGTALHTLGIYEHNESVTVLDFGTEHSIETRPSLEDIDKVRASAYGTGELVRLPVVLQSGLKITVIVTRFTADNSDPTDPTRLLFKGHIANGGVLWAVEGSFFGRKLGWIHLTQRLAL